jgi:hypothetical protein
LKSTSCYFRVLEVSGLDQLLAAVDVVGTAREGGVGHDGWVTASSFLMCFSRRVTVEDRVASFDGLVTGKAGVVHCLVGGFPVVKLSEPPAAGRGIFS